MEVTPRRLDFAGPRSDHPGMRSLLAFLALATLTGCSATGGTSNFSSSSSGTGAAPGTGGAGASGTGGQGAGGFNLGDGGIMGSGGGTGMVVAEVYGQTADTLYKLDPVTNAVTKVGDFHGCDSSVIDIALDKDSNMYGTTEDAFYKIDRATAACTHIADGAYPNSLSFVPVGTISPTEETLVGYDPSNDYIRIDTTTGAITTIGTLADGYASSGDIVSVIGGGTYLTVTGGPNGACGDCIVKVDPKTGAVLGNIGKLGRASVFGLAFWGGSCYGFDAEGQVFQIDLTNASTTLIPTPNAPPGATWYGAGSTTSAPLVPPT
jgi:hypothetical protein